MPLQPKHPSLYEINTRILLNSLGQGSTLSDIPATYWKELKAKGIDWVWLMGIWEIKEKSLDSNLIPSGMMNEFRGLLHDLKDEDICGSPYAIHDYVIDPEIGTERELASLRKSLHKLGINLMLDFVPNHFGAHTKWLNEHPEYFIEIDEARFVSDRKTFYHPWPDREHLFAHGKDPYFDAWQDTVQVNYANPETRVWMAQTLKQIADMCDGVRCDMAMLAVNRIFSQTWGHVVHIPDGTPEFWTEAIAEIKMTHPQFLLLAECYWDMEAELMQQGFDYCYDKVFFDRISAVDSDKMRLHFHAQLWWLERTARFLENHDEHRARSGMTWERQMAAAALVAFGPGMRFWHMGQWEGRRKKVPVQLCRSPHEPSCGCVLRTGRVECTCTVQFYDRLLQLNQESIFREGEWEVAHALSAVSGLICWQWKFNNNQMIVAINFSDSEAEFHLVEQLQKLQLKEPVDIISGNSSGHGEEVLALAPWGVYVWKCKNG